MQFTLTKTEVSNWVKNVLKIIHTKDDSPTSRTNVQMKPFCHQHFFSSRNPYHQKRFLFSFRSSFSRKCCNSKSRISQEDVLKTVDLINVEKFLFTLLSIWNLRQNTPSNYSNKCNMVWKYICCIFIIFNPQKSSNWLESLQAANVRQQKYFWVMLKLSAGEVIKWQNLGSP